MPIPGFWALAILAVHEAREGRLAGGGPKVVVSVLFGPPLLSIISWCQHGFEID